MTPSDVSVRTYDKSDHNAVQPRDHAAAQVLFQLVKTIHHIAQ